MKQPKKELYNEVWFYYKKWLDNHGTDIEWELIISEGNSIIEKYNDHFARSLVGAVINELGQK